MAWTPATRLDYERATGRYASDVTHREWALIAPLLPPPKRRGRPRTTDLREVLNAIFYLLTTGCQWSMLPRDFPPRATVHRYFGAWQKDETWARIHDALYIECRDLEGREEQPSAAIIDSQSVKTGPNACDAVGYDAGKKIKGRKRHILTDTLGLLLTADVHSAGIQDRDGAARLFDRLSARFPFLELIIGDGGYAGPRVRKAAPRPVEIVKRSDHAKGFQVLPKRWIVERTFAWLTINRRLAKDVERYA
jgi:transposase